MVRAPGSATAAPQAGARPDDSESRWRPSGTMMSRSGPGRRAPRPGHSVGRPARRARSMARSRWAGHATAVTCPTRTAAGASWTAARLLQRAPAERRRQTANRPKTLLGERAARDFTSSGSHVQHLLAPLGPRVELVRLVAVGPDLHRVFPLRHPARGRGRARNRPRSDWDPA